MHVLMINNWVLRNGLLMLFISSFYCCFMHTIFCNSVIMIDTDSLLQGYIEFIREDLELLYLKRLLNMFS